MCWNLSCTGIGFYAPMRAACALFVKRDKKGARHDKIIKSSDTDCLEHPTPLYARQKVKSKESTEKESLRWRNFGEPSHAEFTMAAATQKLWELTSIAGSVAIKNMPHIYIKQIYKKCADWKRARMEQTEQKTYRRCFYCCGFIWALHRAYWFASPWH